MNKLAIPCQACIDEFNANIAAAQNQPIDSYSFFHCVHHGIHGAFFADTGDTSFKPCASKGDGELLNGAYIRSNAFYRAQLSQLIASEIGKNTPKQ